MKSSGVLRMSKLFRNAPPFFLVFVGVSGQILRLQTGIGLGVAAMAIHFFMLNPPAILWFH